MLRMRDVYKSYHKGSFLLGRAKTQVLSGINLDIEEGQCIGLVGESGSGKSTLARLIMDLEKPDKGVITLDNEENSVWKKKNPGQLSVVFQDYTSSVNPRFTVEKIIMEPMGAVDELGNYKSHINRLLKMVGLSPKYLNRYPHELSGGQLQRVCIARAISTNPRLIILDEAISSLDTPIQTKILDLLKDIKRELNLTYLFISHDIQAVTYISERIVFLFQGEIVENINVSDLSRTKNLYARRLISSTLSFDL